MWIDATAVQELLSLHACLAGGAASAAKYVCSIRWVCARAAAAAVGEPGLGGPVLGLCWG